MKWWVVLLLILATGAIGLVWIKLPKTNNTIKTVATSPLPKVSPTTTSTPTPTPTAVSVPQSSPIPLVDCVGPDGKKFKTTTKACADFKKAWGITDPTPTPTPGPVVCNTSTDLGNLTVTIQPQSGQSLVGDGYAVMSDGTGSCAGHDSRLPYGQVIPQGSTSVKFSGYRPAKFHVKVQYHGNTFYDGDTDINTGENSINVSVSN